MTIKGFDYLVADNQIHEQFHESLEGEVDRPRFLVFCDAISAADSLAMTRSSQAAATLAEQALSEFLEAQDSIDEECLKKAFTHANERLLELYGDDRQGVAVSAVVMLLQESTDSEQPDSFLIAGVGDARVYRINRDDADVVFSDPHTPDIRTVLGPEERSLALTNALGLGSQLRVTTRHVLQTPFQRYLLMTYGAYAQLSDQEIHQLGLHPHDPIHGVAAVLKRKHTQSHLVRVCTATYEQFPGVQITEETKMLEAEPNNDPAPRRKRSAALAIGGAAAALALTVGLQLGSSTDEGSNASTMVQSAETQELRTALAREQSLRARVQDQLTQTRQELDQLVSKVGQSATNTAEESGDTAEQQDELSRLRREKRMLAAQLDALKRRVNKQGSEKTRGQVSLGQNDSQGLDADESALAQRLDDVTEEYSALQSKYNKLRDEFGEKMSSLQSSYEQERRRNEQLQAEIARGTAQPRGQVNLAEEARTAEKMHQLSTELANTRSANQQLEQQVTQQKAQIALLEKRFADGRANTGQRVLEAKAEVAQESAHIHEQLVAANSRVEELEQALSEERGRPRGTRSQRALISKLRTELSQMKKAQKSGEATAELAAENEALAAKYDEMRTAYMKEQQEAAFLRAQLERAENGTASMMAGASQNELDELTAQLDQLSSAFAAEQQQSASLRMQLRAAQEQAQANLNRAPQAQVQVAELTQQIGELTAALNQEQLQTRHLREEVASLRAEARDELTPQLAQLQAAVNAEQARSSELETELASVTRSASERLSQLKSAYEAAKARAATADSNSAQLGEALARTQELQAERLKLLQDKATLMEGIAKLNELQTLYQDERERRVQAEQALVQAQAQTQAQAQQLAAAAARQSVISNASRSLAMNDTLYAGGSRVHTVQRGETLSGISVKYFDTVTRANDIFEANRDVLPNKNQIRVGMQLVIPDAD